MRRLTLTLQLSLLSIAVLNLSGCLATAAATSAVVGYEVHKHNKDNNNAPVVNKDGSITVINKDGTTTTTSKDGKTVTTVSKDGKTITTTTKNTNGTVSTTTTKL